MNHVSHLIRVGLEIVEFVHSFEFEVVNVFPALVVNNPSAMCALGKPYLIEGGLMKTRNTITKLITMTLAALVAAELLCGAGLLQPVKAQTGDGSVKFVSYASIGIVHGQRFDSVWPTTKSRAEPSACHSASTWHTGATLRVWVPALNEIPVGHKMKLCGRSH